MAHSGNPDHDIAGRETAVAGEKDHQVFVQQDFDVKSVNHQDAGISNTGALAGVEKVQATTQAWTKPWLIASYIRCGCRS